MFGKSGELQGIDIDGNIVCKSKLKMQDVTKYSFDGDVFVAGGSRANNNIVIGKDGEYRTFFLLDNPHYSGVTAINSDSGKIIAVMNGNLESDSYKNLLVVQDVENKVFKKEVIDIYASDVFCKGNNIYVVGSHLSTKDDMWSAKVVKTDFNSGKIEQRIYDRNAEYRKMVMLEGKLYCLSSVVNEDRGSIDVIDMSTLDRLHKYEFDSEISGIFAIGKKLYIITDNKIYEMNDGVLGDIKYPLSENSFVSDYLTDGESVYIFCRYDNVVKENGKTQIGFIVKYDFENDRLVETPISFKGKRYDNIIFFPTMK